MHGWRCRSRPVPPHLRAMYACTSGWLMSRGCRSASSTARLVTGGVGRGVRVGVRAGSAGGQAVGSVARPQAEHAPAPRTRLEKRRGPTERRRQRAVHHANWQSRPGSGCRHAGSSGELTLGEGDALGAGGFSDGSAGLQAARGRSIRLTHQHGRCCCCCLTGLSHQNGRCLPLPPT